VRSFDRTLRLRLGDRLWYWVAGVVLAVIGLVGLPASLVGTADIGLIYAGGAIALNLVTGVAGLPSIGNAAFLAIGAFTVALIPAARSDFYLALVLAVVVTTVAGAIVGLTAWRVSGLYLAVGTLALQFLVSNGTTLYEQHTKKLAGYQVPAPKVFPGVSMSSLRTWFVVLAIALGCIAFVASNLLRSRWGRSWLAIRENDVMARSLGINVARQKLVVFSVSSGMIGLVGALLAFYTLNVDSETFTLTLAIEFVTMIIIGGFGSVPGSIAGAAVVVAIPQLLQHIGGASGGGTGWWAQNTFNVQTGIFGCIIILVLFLAPEGLASLFRRMWRG
jgi:branched-chain amino acid transport system permease protein